MRLLLAALASLIFAGQTLAADLTVVVRTADGQPVQDAVASFVPVTGPAPTGSFKFPWPMEMTQENLQFQPFVLIVPVGAEVVFPNHDAVRHHVYSFSPTKRFELKLYGREQARSVQFDKAGAVALGCNIHDQMVGFIKVVATPYAAKTDANGRAELRDVPSGAGTLTVWHPYMRTADGEVSRKLTAARSSDPEAFTVDLRPSPQRRAAPAIG